MSLLILFALLLGITFSANAASISGLVTDSEGTPINGTTTPIWVNAYSGESCAHRDWIAGVQIDVNGSYSITGLEAGTYILLTSNNNSSDYINEWWTGGDPDPSDSDCQLAQEVTLLQGDDVENRNFKLDIGGRISGIVYDSSGSPITGVQIDCQVYQGDPCGDYQWKTGSLSNSVNGTYVIKGIPEGEYYLRTSNINQSNYIDEWWNGDTQDPSSYQCLQAQLVTVTKGVELYGKDFQLDLGGSVSGTIYQSDGVTPLTDVLIYIHARLGNPCIWTPNLATIRMHPEDGSYVLTGIPSGSVYLITSTLSDYMNEWWANPVSTPDCRGGQITTITVGCSLSGKDFQLDIDTDGDNLADDWEITHFSDLSHNGWGDADGDGLIDRDEYFQDTDPNDNDSDDDFFSDGYEVNAAKTDPKNSSDTPPIPVTLNIINVHQYDGSYNTQITLEIGEAFLGNLPGDIDTITITGPSGVLPYGKSDFTFTPEWREFYLATPGSPEIGVYSGTITAMSGTLSGTDTDYQYYVREIPNPDKNSFSPADGAIVTSKTPIFAWDPVNSGDAAIYYRLWINDMSGNCVYRTGRVLGMLSCAVPVGKLIPGQTYSWRVQAMDNSDYYAVQNQANSDWLTVTMADTLAHSAKPAVVPSSWGGVSWSTEYGTGFLCSVDVMDHDGISCDGSSHQVSVLFPDDRTYSLSFDIAYEPTRVSYYVYRNEVPPDGDYTFTVTDPDGNVSTYVDTVDIQPLPAPDKNSLTPSLKNPVEEHISATFDNVYVNGVPYEDFNSYASINDLDSSKWLQPSGSAIWIQDGKFQTHISDVIGRANCRLPFNNPSAIQSIQADITVLDASSDEAPTARIRGTFFNKDGKDISAAIGVYRNKVHYWVCEDILQGGYVTWNNFIEEDLLTVTPGQTVTASITWDGATMTFYADTGGSGTTGTYTPPGPVHPPVWQGKLLETRINLFTPDTTPTFTWDPVPGAIRYRLRIYNLDNNSTIWRGYTDENETTYTVPPGVLYPDAGYRYRVEAFDAHSPFEIDNHSRTPASSSDHYIFFTGRQEAPEPFIEFDGSGVDVWNSSFIGPHLSFWIKVHDAQGVPEDIKSVTVRFPSGAEEVLYHHIRHSGNTDTAGFYRSSSFIPIEAGEYTFIVEDREGHVTTCTEELTNDPIGYPDDDSLTPLNNTVLHDTAVDFDWDDVQDAAFYRAEIYDKDFNRIWALPTTASQYSIPAGILEEGNLYRYRITTRREFFDQNVDNGSSSSWNDDDMPTFITTPVTGGSSDPTVDLNDMGVAVMRLPRPDSPDVYFLIFNLKVGDEDGIPGNIESVIVTFPDGTTTRNLKYDHEISSTEAVYWLGETYENPADIPEGLYTFTVTDFDGRTAQITDELSISVLPVPVNCSPLHDSAVGGCTPNIHWDDVPGALTYWVRLRDSSNHTIHVGDYLPESSYSIPEGVLDLNRTYSYSIYACREQVPAEDADNLSANAFYFDELPHFTTLEDTDGDGLADETEALLGTDPFDPDTDADGIPDGTEDANHNGSRDPGETDACDWDSDDDDMPDGWEVDHGLDPLVDDALADKDGDGFSNLREYVAGTNPDDINEMPYFEAQTEDFETGDLSRFPWLTAGDALWTVTTTNPYNLTYSAQAGAITDNQITSLEICRYTEAGDLSFWYAVDSEQDYDFLNFYLDGALADQWSGLVPYTQAVFPLTTGMHHFRWEYMKDNSSQGGDDKAWIDTITFPGSVDTDGDGMPDGWEIENDLDPLEDDADGDADGDLFTNGMECLMGTNPCSPTDCPALCNGFDADLDVDGLDLIRFVDGLDTGVVTEEQLQEFADGFGK